MKRSVAVVCSVMLAACVETPPPRAVDSLFDLPLPPPPPPFAPPPALADPEISVMLDDWHAAAASGDEHRYFDHFTSYAVFLGTDGAERWTVPQLRSYAHPHFSRGKAWAFHAKRREITMRGDTAWFDEDLGTERLGPARGSGVVVRDGGRWKIAQYNLSIPIPNDRFEAARSVIEGRTPACPPAPTAVAAGDRAVPKARDPRDLGF